MELNLIQSGTEAHNKVITEAVETAINFCKKNLAYDYTVPEEEVMKQLGVEMSNKIKRTEIRRTIGKWKKVGKKWVCSAKSIDKWINS